MIKENRTIIEITNTHIKVLQVKTQHTSALLTSLDIIEIKDKTNQQLSDALSHCNIKVKKVILVIPKRHVILKQFSMPSIDDAEIHKMLSLKILQEVPFSQDEIVFDDCILEKTKDGYTKVLAAISPLDQISHHFKILEKAGLHVTNVLISSFGIVGWFHQIMPGEENIVGILNLDHDGTELCFCHQGKFLFSRNFNSGISDLNDRNINDMLHQVELTIKAYKMEFPKQDIDKIFIASDVFQIDSLKKGIIERLNIVVETIKPSERIPCDLPVLSLIKNNPMVSLTAGWGYVLSGVDHQIDLTPHSIKNQEQSPVIIHGYVKFLIIVSVLIVLIVSAFSMETYKKYLRVQQLESRLSPLEVTAQNESERLANIHKILPLLENRLPMADLLRDFYQSTPQNIAFKSISLKQNNTFVIEGFAPTLGIIEDFQRKLKALSWFNTVKLQEHSSKQYTEGELVNFKITCQVASSDKTKNR